jgi:hypothetical protein
MTTLWLDANVILRFLTGEPAELAECARRLMARAEAGELTLHAFSFVGVRSPGRVAAGERRAKRVRFTGLVRRLPPGGFDLRLWTSMSSTAASLTRHSPEDRS